MFGISVVFALMVSVMIGLAGGPGAWQNSSEDCWGANRIQTYIDKHEQGTAGYMMIFQADGTWSEFAMSGGATIDTNGVITVKEITSSTTVASPPLCSSDVGTINTTNVTSVAEYGNGISHRSILTLKGTASVIADGAFENAQLLYTFPEGHIVLEGGTADMVCTMTSTNFNASSSDLYNVAVGSVTNTDNDGTISATGADMIANISMDTVSGTNLVLSAQGAIATVGTIYDGTSTAIAVYWNWAVPAANDSGANTNHPSGTVTLDWKNMGTYE